MSAKPKIPRGKPPLGNIASGQTISETTFGAS
jgi:hypothetical protein